MQIFHANLVKEDSVNKVVIDAHYAKRISI